MTPSELGAAFDAVVESPDGVERLRELVLELAVRGKLVPQDPADEAGSLLLQRIVVEKARLVKAGVIRTSTAHTRTPGAEALFDLPSGWSLVRFAEVFLTLFTGPFGTSLKKSDYRIGGTPVINPQNLRAGAITPTAATCVGEATLRRLASFRVMERDVVVARRGEMGRCAVVRRREDGWLCGTGSLVLRPPAVVDAHFVTLFLRSPSTVNRLRDDSVGSTMENLNQRILFNLPFGLPPLAEQRRIVARVDELMDRLDRLAAARVKRDATRAAVRDSALEALREAVTPVEVEVAWNRFAERIDELLCDPSDIAPLREAILRLAVRGRLVRQDPADEPASTLLAGRAMSLSLEDEPFPLPRGWAWSSVDRLGHVLGGGTPSKNDASFWAGKIPWVTPKDMKRDLIADSQDHISEAGVAGSSVKRVPPGALLMVVRGMILAHSFPTALTTTEVTVNQDMKALVPFDGAIGRFLLLVTKGLKRDVLNVVERSTHGTCKLPTDELLGLPLPIATWAEQRRIVARVDELMDLLDRLEARLTAARAAQAAFAAAAVHRVEV
jgi:type I restriction enzyme S subunit